MLIDFNFIKSGNGLKSRGMGGVILKKNVGGGGGDSMISMIFQIFGFKCGVWVFFMFWCLGTNLE